MPYLLHVALLLALCYISYVLLLRKETFYYLNRSILLAGMLLVFVLPLLHIPADWSLRPNPTATNMEVADCEPSISSSPIQLMTDGVHLKTNAENDNSTFLILKEKKILTEYNKKSNDYLSSWDWNSILFYGYLVGVLIFGLNFLIQCGGLLWLRMQHPVLKDEPFTIVELSGERPPFSFFNHIFINPAQYDWETYEQIMAHEKIHATQRHSIDILLAELLKIVLWFNPFAWWYRRTVEDNLEYLTDDVMLGQGTQRESYQMNLLKVAVPHHPLTLGTNYNQSTLKQRIKMMNTKKSSLASSWKYLFLLPVLSLSILSLNDVAATPPSPIASYDATDPTDKDKQKNKKQKKEEVKTQTAKSVEKKKSKAQTKQRQTQLNKHLEIGNIAYVSVKKHVVQIRTQDDQNITFKHDGNGLIYNALDTFKIVITGEDDRLIIINKDGFQMRVGGHTEQLYSSSQQQNATPIREEQKEEIEEASINISENGINITFRDDEQEGVIRIDEKGIVLDGKEFMKIDENGISMNLSDSEEPFSQPSNSPRPTETRNDDIRRLMRSIGYDAMTDYDLKQFEIHKVTPKFINQIKQTGMRGLSARDMTQFMIHGVSANQIKRFRQLGYTDMSPNEIIQLTIHGINMDVVTTLKQMGYDNVTGRQLVQLTIHDVSSSDIRNWAAVGYDDLTVNQMIQMKIQGVDAAFIKKIQANGYYDLSPRQLIQKRNQ